MNIRLGKTKAIQPGVDWAEDVNAQAAFARLGMKVLNTLANDGAAPKLLDAAQGGVSDSLDMISQLLTKRFDEPLARDAIDLVRDASQKLSAGDKPHVNAAPIEAQLKTLANVVGGRAEAESAISPTRHVPSGNITIDGAIDEAIAKAKETRGPVILEWGQTKLFAHPNSTLADVKAPYIEQREASAKAAKEKKAEAAAARLEAIQGLNDAGIPITPNVPTGLKLDPNSAKQAKVYGVDMLLIRRDQLQEIPDGTILTSINGNSVVKGVDVKDEDLNELDFRNGFLELGFSFDNVQSSQG